MPPVGHGLGRPKRGKEMGTTNRAKSETRVGPGSPAKSHKTPRKHWGNKAFWEMLRFWSPQESPETSKPLGKTRYPGQKWISPGGENHKKPYKTIGKYGILSKTEAGPRASLGQPAAGEKWVPPGGHGQAWLRPASAGENGFPKSGPPFPPPPRSVTSFSPRGKTDSYTVRPETRFLFVSSQKVFSFRKSCFVQNSFRFK